MFPNFFCGSNPHLNRKQVQSFTKVSNNIQLIQRLRHKLKHFWLKKNYLLKKLISRLGGTQTRKNFTHLARFARRYLSAPLSSVYSVRLFSEADNLNEQKRNRLLPKISEKLLFLHHNLKKQEQVSLQLNSIDKSKHYLLIYLLLYM